MSFITVSITAAIFFLSWVLALLIRYEFKTRKRKEDSERIFTDFLREYNHLNPGIITDPAPISGYPLRPPYETPAYDNVIYPVFSGSNKDAMIDEALGNRLCWDPINEEYVKYWIRGPFDPEKEK